MSNNVLIVKDEPKISKSLKTDNIIFKMDVEKVLDALPEEPIFDLVVTSPPYDIGKSYEKKMPLDEYVNCYRSEIKILPGCQK